MLDAHVSVHNPKTGVKITGTRAPKRRDLGAWLAAHPGWRPAPEPEVCPDNAVSTAGSTAGSTVGSTLGSSYTQLVKDAEDRFDSIIAANQAAGATTKAHCSTSSIQASEELQQIAGRKASNYSTSDPNIPASDLITIQVDDLQAIIKRKLEDLEERDRKSVV